MKTIYFPTNPQMAEKMHTYVQRDRKTATSDLHYSLAFLSAPNNSPNSWGDTAGPQATLSLQLICKLGSKEVQIDYIMWPKYDHWAGISNRMGKTGRAENFMMDLTK